MFSNDPNNGPARSKCKFFSHLVLGIAALSTAVVAGAQAYPSKPIRVIMSVQGGAEVTVRIMSNKVSEALGQPMVIEMMPAAGGSLAAETVKNAAPDGYTIMYTGASALIIRKFVAKNTRYDALKDFSPIIRLNETVLHMMVNPAVGINNVQDLVDYAKKYPGKLSYGTSGIGTSHHLSAELIRLVAGIDWVHVPYKGAPPVVTDLIAGRIQVGFGTISTIAPILSSGKIRMIAINNGQRYPRYPDVPTITEQLPGYIPPPVWTGYYGPAGLPRPIVQRLYDEYLKAATSAEARSKADELGYFQGTGTPEELMESVRTGLAIVEKIAKGAGIQPE
ncbi:MAG: Bug family tripartite tricarboxylate transporter substrate binding protein [Burkholderiales bacterium]